MKCPKCGSAQTKVEVVQTSSKTNHVSILRRIGICQNCGETWEVE